MARVKVDKLVLGAAAGGGSLVKAASASGALWNSICRDFRLISHAETTCLEASREWHYSFVLSVQGATAEHSNGEEGIEEIFTSSVLYAYGWNVGIYETQTNTTTSNGLP